WCSTSAHGFYENPMSVSLFSEVIIENILQRRMILQGPVGVIFIGGIVVPRKFATHKGTMNLAITISRHRMERSRKSVRSAHQPVYRNLNKRSG
ncbi:hypothetical protein T265_10289, partial [Opisthorchis viverrini]